MISSVHVGEKLSSEPLRGGGVKGGDSDGEVFVSNISTGGSFSSSSIGLSSTCVVLGTSDVSNSSVGSLSVLA